MKLANPLVSVVVPMYNAEQYISKTIASVLRETDIPLEVIVVNDKSTDKSLARVLEFSDERIRVVDGPGRGAPAAMNAGFAEALGAIVMHCDADDLYPANRIRQQLAWLGANPGYDAISGSFSTIDSEGRLVSELDCGKEPSDITEELNKGIVRTSLGTYAIRAQALRRVGEFREYFGSSYDIDMQLRFCEIGRIGYVPEVFYVYRLHASSITHTQRNIVREFLEQTAFEFQKQRQTRGQDDLQGGRPPMIPEAGPTRATRVNAHIQDILIGRAWREHGAGQRATAISTGCRALLENPSNLGAWKSLLALALKPRNGKKE